MDRDMLFVIIACVMFAFIAIIFAGSYKEVARYEAMSKCFSSHTTDQCTKFFRKE